MELAADMLLDELGKRPRGQCDAVQLCPPFRHRFTHLPWFGRNRSCFNADRWLNRMWHYPRYVHRLVGEFQVFHLCDHSYSQLVHALPAERTGVFCHDLDTFQCELEPGRYPRPRWFRRMARHILSGFRKAAIVFHTTDRVREEILKYALVDADRLVKAPLGVCPEFTPGASKDREGPPFLLHVGSCIRRKRIDVLLDVFAALRSTLPELRLVQVGGQWTAEHRERIGRLGIGSAIEQRRGLTREELAELYRHASLVLQPSEAEGFGLPVVEALACGAIVLASDIPPLREVGGDAALYCPVGETDEWVRTARPLLTNPRAAPPVPHRLAQAGRFRWASHAEIIVNAYRRLVESDGFWAEK